MPGADLKSSIRGGRVVVALRGDLDVTGAADAEASITARMARGQSLVIDMSALDFIDCGALGALLRAQLLARRGGGGCGAGRAAAACAAAARPDRRG
jgi:anti-anti-sigma factor